MSQQIMITDSLKACGFDASDIDQIGAIVGASAEKTDANLGEMEPLQTAFSRMLAKLPLAEVEDADGNTTLKLDSNSDAFKDFMGMCRNMAMDRLRVSQRYVATFAKVPTPTGALMWVDISTQKNAEGELVDIDPVKFLHYTTSGSLVDPRQRVKVDDPDLMDQVIKPMRKKFKTAANTALSRLRTRAKGASGTQDFGKKLANVQKVVKTLYTKAKEEAFEVGSEKALNHLLKQIGVVCGIGA